MLGVPLDSESHAPTQKMASQMVRAVPKPFLSSSFLEARRRTLNLYRAWYREVSRNEWLVSRRYLDLLRNFATSGSTSESNSLSLEVTSSNSF